MGISVIYFTNFQYNKAEEQRRVDPVLRTGPKSVLTLSRMVLDCGRTHNFHASEDQK